MADYIRFDVSGLDGVKAKMAQLKHEASYKGGRAALRKATIVLREQARANARRLDDHESTEAIWKNVELRWNGRAFKRNGQLAFRLGVLGGARYSRYQKDGKSTAQRASSNPGGDTWYWRMLEFGTAKMAARPFLRPVADQAGQKAIDTFAREFNAALDRALRKQAKK
ncbi:hypothetical protein D3C81_353670 [compost metagenome]